MSPGIRYLNVIAEQQKSGAMVLPNDEPMKNTGNISPPLNPLHSVIQVNTSNITVATTMIREKMENRIRFPRYFFMNAPT